MNKSFGTGDKVWMPDTGEVGIVVATWLDDAGDQDCYVAFFGTEWPQDDVKPSDKPYVLRYYSASLEPYFS